MLPLAGDLFERRSIGFCERLFAFGRHIGLLLGYGSAAPAALGLSLAQQGEPENAEILFHVVSLNNVNRS